MIRENVTLEDTIKFLNELIKVDRAAVAALLTNRVPCNGNMTRHKTVQVLRRNGNQVGMLGVINGLFGVMADGRGPITLVLEKDEIVGVAKRSLQQENWREDGESGDGNTTAN